MKKIVKVIVFFIILFIILVILSLIFLPKNNTDEAGRDSYGCNQILGEEDNTVDLIVLGNSESFTSIIPMQLWEKYGYTSYLCGNPGQCTPDAMKVLFDVSKNQDLKVVVLESNVIYDDVSIAIPFTRIIYEILPISEFHDRWRTIGVKDIFSKIEYTSTDYLRGYYPKAKLVDPADASNYMKYTDEKEEISKRGKVYLKIMNEYCKMNNTKFIIMSVPSTKNWNYKKHNAVKEFCDGEGIEFIDFNILADELKIDWNNDTLDAGDHMNYYGSTKLTNYFGKYLYDNKLLESHKDDTKYNNWNEDYIKYKKDMDEL